jgi:hypothetical protein
MNSSRRTRRATVSLTTAALLGGGLLAGCSHSVPVAQGAASSSTPAAPTVSAKPTVSARLSATPVKSTVAAAPSAPPAKSTVAAAPSAAPVKSTVAAAPSATTPAALSASDLLSAAQAAVRSSGSVHTDVTYTSNGTALHYSDDATPTEGRQVVTDGNGGQETVLLVNGIGYVQGNAEALEVLSGLSAQQAGQFAGQWIEVRPGQKLGPAAFSDVISGLSLPSVASELTLSGAPSLVKPITIGGQPANGLQGTTSAADGFPIPATSVLYVADNAQRLPVQLSVQGNGYTYQMTFSQWGEAVHLTAPTQTIPATQVTPVS